ncbi:MAG: hypothetical protein M1834_009230 [Cirrosporium novae-zelandiae]|nr:MAG: hypothetical protein M1834_009230 [Cirrosporium novae-zelandiae]
MLSLSLSIILTQLYPPKSDFTDKVLPSLHGKVHIVTGSNTGVGKELARILYSKHAKVYVAARSEDKANKAIEAIKKTTPESAGELIFLYLDLIDLTTIKASAENLLSKENKLHVLFNNAGVMGPPQGSKTAQGYELQLGVNNIGTFMFTKLLTPILVSTAKVEPPNTVRVIWLSSSATEFFSPKSASVPLDNLDYHNDKSATYKYAISKAGNYLHAVEFSKRYKTNGVISISLNPGNLRSELTRHQGALLKMLLKYLFQYPPIFGAYTELFAGLSPKVTIEKSGDWVVPWGRFMAIRKDLVDATKIEEEGGTGVGLKFWEWTEEQIKPYA